jgi:hypothetical protein
MKSKIKRNEEEILKSVTRSKERYGMILKAVMLKQMEKYRRK